MCTTVLTESSEEKTRHPAILLALSETGGKFTSSQEVTAGEAIGVILNTDVRYAVRGHVAWTRGLPDKVHYEFGVDFEEEIPDSLRINPDQPGVA